MRSKAWIIAVLLLVCWAAYGDASSSGGTAVTLQNQEDSPFYFVVDPAELSGISASSPLLTSEVTRFFSKETPSFPFTAIQPNTGLTLEGLAEGTHLLVGFFAIEEMTEFPVRIVSLQVDKKLGRRVYELYSEPAFLNSVRGVGMLTAFGATPGPVAAKPKEEAAIPAQTAVSAAVPETEKPAAVPAPVAAAPASVPIASAPQAKETTTTVPEIAAFPLSFNPTVFTREKESAFSVLPIEQSVYWNRNGTRIAVISGSLSYGTVNLELKSASGFAKDVSYFLYLFPARKPGQVNPYTIEIKPVIEGRSEGIALLWMIGHVEPYSFGTLKLEGPVLKITAVLSALPADFSSNLGAESSADVTSCYFDQGAKTYEEFFYTSFALSELALSTH
jgi:hypothetical protein